MGGLQAGRFLFSPSGAGEAAAYSESWGSVEGHLGAPIKIALTLG